MKRLFMSGYPAPLATAQGALTFDEGVSFLEKPFSPAKLAEQVRQALASA